MLDVKGSIDKLRARYADPGKCADVKQVFAALAAGRNLDAPSKLTGELLREIKAADIHRLSKDAIAAAKKQSESVTTEQATAILGRFLDALSFDLRANGQVDEAYVVGLFAEEREARDAGTPSAGTGEAMAALFPKP